MARNISNQNGRALEYKIVDFLLSKKSKFSVSLSRQAEKDQQRDIENYKKLPEKLRVGYGKCAEVVHDWLLEVLPTKEVALNKLTDQEAKKGDVTDIQILCKGKALNLSIKHNHKALKHQRPPTTANWCGYPKKSSEDLKFREKYAALMKRFLEGARKFNPDAVNFRDLTLADPEYINDNLYKPVCELVVSTITNLCKSQANVIHLFQFLSGTTNFYKIIDFDDKVVILDLTTVDLPSSVSAKMKKKSYVDLDFSNNWILSMRLHTAASKLGRSLKFDTQPLKIIAEEIIIPKPS